MRRQSRSNPGSGHRHSARRSVTLITREAFCVLAGISESQLRLWEHERLIAPASSRAELEQESLYDAASLRRARLIRTLAEDLEVNLPGIDVILNLLDQIAR
jgi:DNA-binding transcriptional MerR regulator